MSTVIECPSCRSKVRLPEELAGQPVRCPTCGSTFEAEPPPTPVDGDRPAKATARRARREADTEPCPYCGDLVSMEAASCPHCGADLEEEDDRPWERPGGVRRDTEPHRGGLVLTLGILSIVGAPLTLCCGIIGVLLNAVGIALGITALVMARRDLKKMQANVMDPQGRATTQGGWICAVVGTILCSFGLALGILITAAMGFMMVGAGRMAPPPALPPPRMPAPAPGAPPKMFVRTATPLRLQDYLPGNHTRPGGAASAPVHS